MVDENIAEIRCPKDCSNFYITSAGRIWGVKDEEKLAGEAQERRNVLGNSFRTMEEACYIKSQIEAWTRLKKYASTNVICKEGRPVIELAFDIPAQKSAEFSGDIMLLANQYGEGRQKS